MQTLAAMSLRLHVPQPLEAGRVLALPPAAARHVQVRRLQPGEPLVLFDGLGHEVDAVVLAMRRDGVDVRVESAPVRVDRELPCPVTLAVGMPANDRMDWLVEKATELGVARVQPLLAERSVLRLAGERAERRREHWQGVAVAACEQCGRARVPDVEPVRTLPEWLSSLPDGTTRWMLAPGAPPLQGPSLERPVLVLSGPEGGLSPTETQAALEAGFTPIGLGPRILRAETAPLAVLAWLGLAG
jgi:16S rRNA (uracil1498-N3)-methyltransferase